MRRLAYAGIGLLLAGLLLWALVPRPVSVETAEIARRNLEVHVEEEGEARIREVFTVSAPIAGRMLRLDLEAGDTVTAGQTIASIVPQAPGLLDARARATAEAEAEAARAAVDLATAEVTRAEAELDYAKSEERRAEELLSRDAVSMAVYDKARLDARAAEAALASARANLVVRQRQLESAEALLIEGDQTATGPCCMAVTAPASGRILRVLTQSEQVVQAGVPLMDIGDPADLEIDVDLRSNDAVRVAPGAPATVEGWGGPPIEAIVERIEPSAYTKVSALGIEEQRVPVVLSLTGDPATRAGLGDNYRVLVRILIWKGENRVTVPISSLFRIGPDWAVYRVSDGRAEVVRLDLGERNETFAEVLDGLKVGDTVIVHPGDLVSDGVRVAAAK